MGISFKFFLPRPHSYNKEVLLSARREERKKSSIDKNTKLLPRKEIGLFATLLLKCSTFSLISVDDQANEIYVIVIYLVGVRGLNGMRTRVQWVQFSFPFIWLARKRIVAGRWIIVIRHI